MKRLLIMLLMATWFAVGNASSSAYAPNGAIVCVPDGRGGMCCWETTVEGPFRPVSC